MPWNRIIGHATVLARLSTALRSGRLHPALLFEGPEGIGKRLTAVTLAQALQCPQAPDRGGDPCGVCRSCLAVDASARPDMVAEGQSAHPAVRFVGLSRADERESRFGGSGARGEIRAQIAVSQIRTVLSEMRGRSLASAQRIVIIDPADRLGESAANALLKTLEEPTPSERFVLITSRPSALLPTILSRCSRVRFGAMSDEEVSRALHVLVPCGGRGPASAGRSPAARGPEPSRAETGRSASARSAPGREGSDELALIASLAGGRIGRAVVLSEGAALSAFRESRGLLLEALEAHARGLGGGTFAVLAGASFRAREREDWVEGINVLELLLRDIAVLAADPEARIVNLDLRERLRPLAEALGARAARALAVLDGVRSDLRFNVNGRLAAERILLEIAR